MINERQLRLFDILNNSDEYLPSKKLADELKVSTKTIFFDLSKLSSCIDKYELRIEKKPRYGLNLVGTHEQRQIVKEQLFRLYEKENQDKFSPSIRRQEFFKKLFLSSEKISLQELAFQYYVSKSSILNDLEYISMITEKYNVKISTIDNRITIVGEELSIQSAAVSFLLSESNKEKGQVYLEAYFDPKMFKRVSAIYTDIKERYFHDLSDYYDQSLFATILVQISRLFSGYHAPSETSDLLDEYTYMEFFSLASEILKEISCQLSIHLSDGDIQTLSRQLYVHKVNPSLPDKDIWDDLVDELMKRFELMEGIRIFNRNNLKKQLLFHIPPMIINCKFKCRPYYGNPYNVRPSLYN